MYINDFFTEGENFRVIHESEKFLLADWDHTFLVAEAKARSSAQDKSYLGLRNV